MYIVMVYSLFFFFYFSFFSSATKWRIRKLGSKVISNAVFLYHTQCFVLLGWSKSLGFSSIWNTSKIKSRLESGMKLSAIYVASPKLKTTDIQWRFSLKSESRSIWKLLIGENGSSMSCFLDSYELVWEHVLFQLIVRTCLGFQLANRHYN